MSEVNLVLSDRSSSGFSFLCKENDQTVGKIHITINGDEAFLADINVSEFKVRRFSFVPFLKRTVSYRNRSYGTTLLAASIKRCRDKNIKVIRGVMHGDIDRLTSWYSRNGFEIRGNEITLHL